MMQRDIIPYTIAYDTVKWNPSSIDYTSAHVLE